MKLKDRDTQLINLQEKYDLLKNDHRDSHEKQNKDIKKSIEAEQQQKQMYQTMPVPVTEAISEKRADPMVTHFVESRFGKKFKPIVTKSLEFVLNQQLQIRLFRETYYFLERSILQKRLSQLSSAGGIMINCCVCERKLAHVQCHDCENDCFC